jgi:hypothetical protein
MRALWIVLAVAALLAASPVARAENVTLEGTVSDMDGEPVKDVDVATMWIEGEPANGAKTGKDGTFELEARHYGRPIAVLVMDAKRERGAVAVVEPDALEEPVNLTITPLVHVHGTFTSEELGVAPPWTNVYLNLTPGRLRVARFMSEKAEFSFRVPVGSFQLYMYGTDVQRVTRALDIESSEEAELDLGAIDLKATPLAKLYGKEMPEWTVTDARGAEKDVKLADYRGRWVLIEFWFST